MTQQAYASIDIGSNTFRLLIAKRQQDKHVITPWHILAYTHRIIRLGEGLHQSGKLCDAAMQRAMHAFHDFSELLKEHHIEASQLSAVATAAMRDAENGLDFCQQVKIETGIHIQIIDGTQEANRSLAGSCAVLPKDICHDLLLFDIGGGSTEFVRAKDSESIDAISRKMGVVRLIEAHLHSDPPSKEDYKAMKAVCHQHLDAVEEYWQESNQQVIAPKYLVGTAGTVTTLAAIDLELRDYNADIVNNHCISKQRFFDLRDRLLAMTLQKRQAILFERWHYESLIIVDAGLLEGTWLNIAANN